VKEDISEKLDRAEMLKTVVSLRKDVCSMATDIQAVIAENEQLQKEISGLRENAQRKSQQFLEAKRLQQEIDQLTRLYETVTTKRGCSSCEEISNRRINTVVSPRDSTWMKKVMMVMMLGELV